jgi:hypothetical protein
MAQQGTIMQILKEQQEILMQIRAELQQTPKIPITLRRRKTTEKNTSADFMPTKVLTTLKTASRMNEPYDTYITLEKPPTSKVRSKETNIIETAKRNKELRAMYIAIGRDLKIRAAERDESLNEQSRLIRRAKKMDIDAENVQNFGNRVEQLESEFENLRFWNWIRKRRLEKEIEKVTVAYRSALYYFGKDYHANPHDIPEKIAQIEEKIKDIEPKITMKNAKISKLMERQAAVKQEYDEHKFMILKKPRQQFDYFIEPSNITGLKQSVMGFMQELRRDADEQRRRKKVQELKRAIKPKRMLMITSPKQKKRNLASVIGLKYRKTAEDARPISTFPIKNYIAVS